MIKCVRDIVINRNHPDETEMCNTKMVHAYSNKKFAVYECPNCGNAIKDYG